MAGWRDLYSVTLYHFQSTVVSGPPLALLSQDTYFSRQTKWVVFTSWVFNNWFNSSDIFVFLFCCQIICSRTDVTNVFKGSCSNLWSFHRSSIRSHPSGLRLKTRRQPPPVWKPWHATLQTLLPASRDPVLVVLTARRRNQGRIMNQFFPSSPSSWYQTKGHSTRGGWVRMGPGNPGKSWKILKPWKPLEKPWNFFYYAWKISQNFIEKINLQNGAFCWFHYK